MTQAVLVGWVIIVMCVIALIGMTVSLVIGVITIAIERKRNKWLR